MCVCVCVCVCVCLHVCVLLDYEVSIDYYVLWADGIHMLTSLLPCIVIRWSILQLLNSRVVEGTLW